MTQLKHPNKSHPKFTGDIITEIVNTYQTGLTAQQVADQFSAAQDTILKILRKEGVTRTAGETKTLPLPKDAIIDLYTNKDWSATKIAKKFGTSANIILNRLRSWKIMIVKIKQPKFHDLNIAELSEMYKSNKPTCEIAKHFGVSSSVIQRRLRENDIPMSIGRPKWKQLPYNELKTLYESGKSIQSISNMFNCSNAHVYNTLTEMKLVVVKHKLSEPECSIALDMYNDGKRVRDIALHFNASEKNIYKNLHILNANLIHSGFGVQSKTLDGTVVRSRIERFVADWLISNNINFEYEPNLQNSKFRADFRIENTFVEVCGMYGITNDIFGYDKRLQRKIEFYENNNLKYVLLFPQDITHEHLHKTFF